MSTTISDTITMGNTVITETNIKGLSGYDSSKGTIEERLLAIINSIPIIATVTYTRNQSQDGGRTKYTHIYFNTNSGLAPAKTTYEGKTYSISTNTNASYSGAYYISLSNVGNSASAVTYPTAPALGTLFLVGNY